MARTRFLMIGGFLGAGKTTAIARLARTYIEQGLNVGLVTNDQAYQLVDTQSLRAQGFTVGEVPGACFCCKFNDLVETVAGLSKDQRPDVIITEPVGSCTDLVATVIEPLRHLHGDQYEVGPLVVLCKPEHGKKILGGNSQTGFSPKAAYIFLKQLEEADVVVINKVDKLSSEEVEELIAAVRKRFPKKTVLVASGKEGQGFEQIVAALQSARPEGQLPLDIDYDIYAEGEAELGWLNCSAEVRATDTRLPFSLDDIVVELVQSLAVALEQANFEPAHLKVLGQTDSSTSIANLVSSDDRAELSLAAEIETVAADLLVNARVGGDPNQLASIVQEQFKQLAARHDLSIQIEGMQHFRPGRPEPTHRMPAG